MIITEWICMLILRVFARILVRWESCKFLECSCSVYWQLFTISIIINTILYQPRIPSAMAHNIKDQKHQVRNCLPTQTVAFTSSELMLLPFL